MPANMLCSQQQVFFAAPFASLGFSLKAAKAGNGQLLEPATGLQYPLEFCVTSQKACPQLAGLGVRRYAMFCAPATFYGSGVFQHRSQPIAAHTPFNEMQHA